MTPGAAPGADDRLLVAAGPRVRLRYKTLADAFDEYRWRRDPETARLNASPPLGQSFSRFLETFEHDLRFGAPEREQFAIDTVAGEHVGTVMYYNGASGEAAEFGISIGDARFWGSGLGREATILFLRHFWATHPHRGVYLHTLASNIRAQRCFQSAGFSETGTLERGGEPMVRMESRREWWLLWDLEGRFQFAVPQAGPAR